MDEKRIDIADLHDDALSIVLQTLIEARGDDSGGLDEAERDLATAKRVCHRLQGAGLVPPRTDAQRERHRRQVRAASALFTCLLEGDNCHEAKLALARA